MAYTSGTAQVVADTLLLDFANYNVLKATLLQEMEVNINSLWSNLSEPRYLICTPNGHDLRFPNVDYTNIGDNDFEAGDTRFLIKFEYVEDNGNDLFLYTVHELLHENEFRLQLESGEYIELDHGSGLLLGEAE